MVWRPNCGTTRKVRPRKHPAVRKHINSCMQQDWWLLVFFGFFSFSFQNSSTLDLPELKLRLLMFVCLPCLYHIFMFVNKVLNSTHSVLLIWAAEICCPPLTHRMPGWTSLFKIKLVLLWKTRRKRRSLGWGLFFFFFLSLLLHHDINTQVNFIVHLSASEFILWLERQYLMTSQLSLSVFLLTLPLISLNNIDNGN